MATKYKITVGEPWDFDGPAGQNLILGEVVKVISPTCIIFRSDHELNFEKGKGRFLVLSARYEKEVLSKGNAYEGTVGGGILLTENFDAMDEESLQKNSKYVLIGGLHKV